MNFLYPAFLLGGLAIAIPIVLHLLRRDVAPDVPFTAVRLLKKSPIERSRRRRLRDVVLLAARIAALLLLAAAFARPFAPARSAAMAPLRIIAVDRSFSMGAPGRFDRALELARAAIDEAAFGERIAVVAFDERADVIAQPGSAADARAALASLRPGHGGTRFPAALAKASELATGGPVRLVLVTDLQRAGWEGESRVRLPASVQIDVREAGVPTGNMAVAAARPADSELVASVRNASPNAATGVLTVTHDGREVARAAFTAPPNATVDVAVPWKPSAGGVVVALDDEEGFPADDARHMVIGARTTRSVLVIASAETPGFYLQRALGAAEAGRLIPFGARAVSAAEIAGGRAETITRHAGVVLLSTRGLDRAARETIGAFVKGGGGLLIAAAPEVEPEVIASMFGWEAGTFRSDAEARAVSFTATDIRHPILRPFGTMAANLGQVRFTRAWRVAAEGWHVAARFDDGTPALLERPHGAGRVVVFASDLDRRWNDFPLHPSFVPFAVEAVRHIASRVDEPDEFTVGRVPHDLQGEPGVHRLESGRLVAVNVDPRESSIGAMTPEEFLAMVEPVDAASSEGRGARDEQVESRQSLWQYGLLLMLAALVAESVVGRA